jgi:hypothetical protein
VMLSYQWGFFVCLTMHIASGSLCCCLCFIFILVMHEMSLGSVGSCLGLGFQSQGLVCSQSFLWDINSSGNFQVYLFASAVWVGRHAGVGLGHDNTERGHVCIAVLGIFYLVS